MAEIAVPVTTFSEYDGTIINCDGVLQVNQQAVRRNTPPMEIGTW